MPGTWRPWDRRRRAEAAAAALRAAGFGCWALDVDQGSIDWIEGGHGAFGPGQDREALDHYLDRVHAADRDRLRRAIHAAGHQQAPLSLNHRVRCADGGFRWAYLQGRVERDAAGRPSVIRAVLLDDADRNEAIERLQVVVNAAAATPGEPYFQTLVAYLCHAAKADHAFIARTTTEGRLRTLAVFSMGAPADDFDIVLEGTPWQPSPGESLCYVPDRAAERFPRDPVLSRLGADACLGAPMTDEAGAPLGLVAVLHSRPFESPDTAKALVSVLVSRAAAELARRQANEALRRQTALLQSVLTSIGDGVAVCDADGHVVYVNPAGRALAGVREGEPVKVGDFDLAPAEDEAPFTAGTTPMARALAGEHVRGATVFLRGPGRDRWLDITATPIAEDGAPEGAVAVFRDVSQQRRADEALRQSELRYRQLFEQSQAITFVIDRAGLLLDINQAAAQGLGYEREALIGRDGLALVADDSRQAARAAIDRAFGGPGTVTADIDVVTARGERRSLLIAAGRARLREGERVTSILVSALDITDRKLAEAERVALEGEMRQVQKLEAVGQLAGGVAHDFNNLLQAIHGYLRLALDDIPPESPANRRLVEAVRAADRAAELTRRLLAFSRHQAVERRPIDPGRAIDEAAALLRRVIGEHITLHVEREERPWGIVADAGQVEQVLLNLAVNARDAMPGGGVARIALRNRTLDSASGRLGPGRYVEIEVTDTGHGIPNEIRPRIFDPFFTTKEVGEGTGLGLATVYAIVSGLDGDVDVQSEVGVGTTFRVRLPAIEPVVEPARIAPGKAPAGGSETLLVAEDEDLVRELTVEMLETAGYRVVVARDGEEAAELFCRHAHEIRLALLDVVMPRRSGREVQAMIAAIRPGLPVLFASGYGFDLRDGTPVIQKPYSRHDLLQRIRALIDGSPEGT